MKFWFPKYQAWMSLGEFHYRANIAPDQHLVARETPHEKVDHWMRTVYDKVVHQGS